MLLYFPSLAGQTLSRGRRVWWHRVCGVVPAVCNDWTAMRYTRRARTNILTAISSTKVFTARFLSSFKLWYRSDAEASSIKTSSPPAMSSEG